MVQNLLFGEWIFKLVSALQHPKSSAKQNCLVIDTSTVRLYSLVKKLLKWKAELV